MSKTSPLRPIAIDGVSYLWRIRRLDPHTVLLSVWLAQKASTNQELRVRLPFDDPWLNYGPLITAPPDRIHDIFVLEPITPARVRQIILAALQTGWRPDGGGQPLTLEWVNDTTLRPTTS
jgi:hypothetical protein